MPNFKSQVFCVIEKDAKKVGIKKCILEQWVA